MGKLGSIGSCPKIDGVKIEEGVKLIPTKQFEGGPGWDDSMKRWWWPLQSCELAEKPSNPPKRKPDIIDLVWEKRL